MSTTITIGRKLVIIAALTLGTSVATTSLNVVTFAQGTKQKVSGIIVKRDGDTIVIKDDTGKETSVKLSSSIQIKEKKGNPFRGARKYDHTQLVRGLALEVEGQAGGDGILNAQKVKINNTDMRIAQSLDSRTNPLENRTSENENRINLADENAKRLSGQLDELGTVADMARGGAKGARDTADKALGEATNANTRISETNSKVAGIDNRISLLDEYEAKSSSNIIFKAGSAVLTKLSKAALDELATKAKAEKTFVIQVAGFASADGDKNYNRRLSEQRAEVVVRYLIENHDIEQRRIIPTYGYGELKAVGDNKTRQGRAENRRVEVSILVSKGLATASM